MPKPPRDRPLAEESAPGEGRTSVQPPSADPRDAHEAMEVTSPALPVVAEIPDVPERVKILRRAPKSAKARSEPMPRPAEPSAQARWEAPPASARPRSASCVEAGPVSDDEPLERSEEMRDGAGSPAGRGSQSKVRVPRVTADAMRRLASRKAEAESAPDPRPEDALGEATQAGPPISVAVIRGPDCGKRQRIRGSRMVVGRAEDCDLRLTDGLVSRRHLELVTGPRGVVLRDLGSNNGTRVNGERQVEVAVRHRDEIELGGSVLSVIDPIQELEERKAPKVPPPVAPEPVLDARPLTKEPDLEMSGPPQVPAGRPRRRVVLLAGAAGLAVLALAAATWLGRRSPLPIPPPIPPPAPSSVPSSVSYDAQLKTARGLMNAGEHAKALKALEALAGRYPKAPQLNGHIELCKRELRSGQAMLAARALAGSGELEKAIAAAKAVESGTGKYGEAQALIAQWTLEHEKDQVDQFRATLAKGDLEPARRLLDLLPADARPAAREELSQAEQREKQRQAEEQRRAQRERVDRQQEELRRTRDEVDRAIAGVVRKMDVGNLEGALGEVERIAESKPAPAVVDKIGLLRTRMPSFAEHYRDGTSKYAAGELEEAAKPLLQALTDYEVMDLAGNLDVPLKQKTARALARRGRAEAAREEWTDAGRDLRLALKIEPGLKEAAEGLAAMARSALRLFDEGCAIMPKDESAARLHFEQVILMTGPGNELQQKAKRRLEQLDRGR